MAKRRKVTVNLKELAQGVSTQEVGGFKRTEDKNFPVFDTPVNRDILVYIPRTNVVETENGEEMEVCNAHLHQYRKGNGFGQIRCIANLEGGVFDELGYDGTCPACEGVSKVWDLFNAKLEKEALALGIDPMNDPEERLKPVREKLMREMHLEKSRAYVTFPVVIIPTDDKFKPIVDDMSKLKVEYVTWTKDRYAENILAGLDTLMPAPDHEGGTFWKWKFSYDTKGKEATKRDSAKNATYTVIPVNPVLKEFVVDAEEKAKDFTVEKAIEVIIVNQFLYKEDMDDEIASIMRPTLKTLEMLEVQGGIVDGAIAGGVAPAQPQIGDPLSSFGVDTQTVGLDVPPQI